MHIRRARGELAISAFLLAVSAFFLWGAWRMPAGTSGVPGPGTVPLIVSALLVVSSLALVVKALVARTPSDEALTETRFAPGAIIFASLTGVAVAIEYAGFIVTLSVFLFVMLRVFSRLSTLRSVVAAIVITFAANWFFVTLLGVTLPRW